MSATRSGSPDGDLDERLVWVGPDDRGVVLEGF
jgi:hypothetical protein